MVNVKAFWRNDYFKTAIAVLLIVGIIAGFFLGLQVVLGSAVPIRVVESGSMCVQYDGACDGWSHPFNYTLHKGDIIIIQKVNPSDLKANYPNSDIIVYKNPYGDIPIVHRIAEKHEINGTLFFKTKGDGNNPPNVWPATPNNFDNIPDSNGVPQNLIEGKVILRIPWFGWITLFMRGNSWSLPAVIALIILLVVIEFVLPVARAKRKAAVQQKNKPAQAQIDLLRK